MKRWIVSVLAGVTLLAAGCATTAPGSGIQPTPLQTIPLQTTSPDPVHTLASQTNEQIITPASCGGDSYVNVDGNCVHRPVSSATAPAGATARCVDGTFSFSQHRQGTCSHHGGVAAWL